MSAREIVAWLDGRAARGARLCLDTRQLRAGDVFFACPGLSADGKDFIAQAVARGAAAIVTHALPEAAASISVPMLQVDGLASKLGAVAHSWYGEPSANLKVVAVTGTNGKTSCVQWLANALNAEGVPCGAIGTLGVTLPDGGMLHGALTTPDVLTLHAGAQVVAMEASSIGIDQGRMDEVMVDIAGFTNLTRDHLDYHRTEENYKRAKFALFERPGLQRAIVNADDAAGRELLAMLPAGLAQAYSIDGPEAAIRAEDIHAGADGLVFTLAMPAGTAQILTHLLGRHNVSNLLLLAGILSELGWSVSRIARVLAALHPVAGRLQAVVPVPGLGAAQTAVAGAPLVVVDYAHTPDALERALAALRPQAEARGGRLVCVFGCGGSRDSGKRPIMGGIASRAADAVILTSDNPRAEDPALIIEQIAAGMPVRPHIEADRAIAILTAIWGADSADIVLVAGKGHETYQEINGVRTQFDDREWARFALAWGEGLDVSTDTRSLVRGQLFVALKGDQFDGHSYLAAAEQSGAAAAVVEHANPDLGLPQFVLGDTRQALIRIATAWRRRFDIPVIAVTGSNGKTTTKEMIAAILREAYGEEASLATRGNFNNDIGVPLSVLRLRHSHRAAVLELGMNHPGEIAVLAAIAQPEVALVNNAQREHQEFMQSVEAVAHENGSVFESLPANGVAVFPGDDAYAALWTGLAKERQTMQFGFEPTLDVYADAIHAEPSRTRFVLVAGQGSAEVALCAPGVHNLRNALAAAASTLAAGVALDAVARGLAAFSPVKGRMQPRELAGGYQLIDDTYNANPDSVRAAIDVLAQLKGPKILVLGDMGEVGVNGPAMHTEVGRYARERGVDALLAFGVACERAVEAFGAEGRSYQNIDSLAQDLAARLPANILVKGSRSMRMERVIKALEDQRVLPEQGASHVA
jgi:murE/murF fusion protein